MEDLIQRLWDKFLLVGENVISALEGKITYPVLELKVKEILNKLGKEIMKMVLEAQDAYIVEHREERPGWVIERRQEEKHVVTVFGEMCYRRTYFYHKETQSYAHLADAYAGYTPHMRVDAAVKALLADMATEQSYRRSGRGPEQHRWGESLSGQTVKNTIDGIKVPLNSDDMTSAEKRTVKVLYIEADEDHVARRGKKGRMPIPLVYVHEGIEEAGRGRNRLRNARYFSGPYKTIDDLWFAVLDYIENQYELDQIERIYINGDGAAWMRSGTEIIPKSVFVLDRFHLSKYIIAAVGSEPKLQKAIWEHIERSDLERVMEVLDNAQKLRPDRQKAIKKAKRYIRGQWDGIETRNRYREEVHGCSAEGHVSHILSARLSNRPGAWSKGGAEQMAALRAAKANGLNIQEIYLAQQPQPVKVLQLDAETLKRAKRTLQKKTAAAMIRNMPILNGPQSPLTKTLRALAASA